MNFTLRRARRTDLGAISALLEKASLPGTANDRAGLRRFRNIVADLGCDFDVAGTRDGVRGFVHLTYARDLHSGNRAQLLALVFDSTEVLDALLAAAIERALRRHCRDLSVIPGPWSSALESARIPSGWERIDGCLRIDLSPRSQTHFSEAPATSR